MAVLPFSSARSVRYLPGLGPHKGAGSLGGGARWQGAFNSWAEGKLPVDRQPAAPFPSSAQSALALGLTPEMR